MPSPVKSAISNNHFRDIETNNTEKSVGRHFNTENHKGIKDMSLTILEFIKKPPRSPQAIKIRASREKHWTYLLRSLAPIGLNMEDPKEFKSHSSKNNPKKTKS